MQSSLVDFGVSDSSKKGRYIVGFNGLAPSSLLSGQTATFIVKSGEEDLTLYIGPNATGFFMDPTNNVITNGTFLTMVDQRKIVIFDNSGNKTFVAYLVTVRNENAGGVTFEFGGGGF